MLNIIYLCIQHEEICRFPSDHFYEGQLNTDISVKRRNNRECQLDNFWPRGPNCPILFCDIVGSEGERETTSREGRKVAIGSKSNRKDALKTVSGPY